MSTPHLIAMCGPCDGTGVHPDCPCDRCVCLSGDPAHPCPFCDGHGTVGPVCGRPGCDVDCPACRAVVFDSAEVRT